MKYTILSLLLASLLFSGCSAVERAGFPKAGPTLDPKIINHGGPSGYYPDALIRQTGCVPAGTTNDWECDPASRVGSLGCASITTGGSLGGLSDPALVLSCYAATSIHSDYFISRQGCLDSFVDEESPSDGFLLIQDGEYRLLNITGISDLQNTFAPIESGSEALSYAIAASNFYDPVADLYPQFVIDTDWGFSAVYSGQIEGTHADPVADGYEINMFTGFDCGCDYKKIFEVKVLVSRDGEIKVLERALKYTTDMVCVD